MSRPSRTARPCARSAANSSGGPVGVRRRLVAGGPQPLLERGVVVGQAARGLGRRRRRRARARARRARAGPAGPAGRARPVAARAGSSTTPPPSVSGGASERITSAVAGRGHDRLLEPQLEEAAAELREPRRRLPRAVVDGDARAAVGARVRRGPRERDVDAEVGASCGAASDCAARPRPDAVAAAGHRFDDHVAAPHLVAAHAGEVQRHPLAGRRRARPARRGPRPRGPGPRGPAGRIAHAVAARRGARPQRPGHDGPRAADRERAVDVQPQRPSAAARQTRRPLVTARRAARPAPRR